MRNWAPHLGFILVYILWGINTSSMKIGGAAWNPVVFNGLRFTLAAPVLWAVAVYLHKKGKISLRMKAIDVLQVGLLGILSAAGMEVLLSYALQYSNTANAAVLGRGMTPIITASGALLLRQLKLSWRLSIGIPAAFAGVVAIVSASGLHFGMDTYRGDLLLLARSVIGAAYLIGMSRMVRKYPLPLVLAVENTGGALGLLPFVFAYGGGVLRNMPEIGWISLIYTTVFASLIGYSLHNWCLGKLGPVKSAAYGFLLPLTAAAGGVVLLQEHLRLQQIAGGAVVLIGMYLVQRDRAVRVPASQPVSAD